MGCLTWSRDPVSILLLITGFVILAGHPPRHASLGEYDCEPLLLGASPPKELPPVWRLLFLPPKNIITHKYVRAINIEVL